MAPAMARVSGFIQVAFPAHAHGMSSHDPTDRQLLTPHRKALLINLDDSRYGTFAEIGAGQEVARHFFHVGGASGTVAKTMSAYDMAFSDAIYGKTKRYVSRERLATMLDHEYDLLLDRLSAVRGERTRFFVFADTVAARSYRGNNECHGWLGVRFQRTPGEAPSEIIAHVRMWDKENVMQQQAIGIFGVNLLYAAFEYADQPLTLVRSLVDNVGSDRIEVDYLDTAGPAFATVNNRELNLLLVEEGLTNGVLFAPDGRPVVTGEVLYKKAVLVQRGSFRPVTRVNEDLMACALRRFKQEPSIAGREIVTIYEISLTRSKAAGNADTMK
ncbi:MAG: TonB-dependent receptor, partial [Verrucomicrobia bacterium]